MTWTVLDQTTVLLMSILAIYFMSTTFFVLIFYSYITFSNVLHNIYFERLSLAFWFFS